MDQSGKKLNEKIILDNKQSESVDNMKFGWWEYILKSQSLSFIKYLHLVPGSWREIKWEELGFHGTPFVHLCFYLNKVVLFVMPLFCLSVQCSY